MTQDSEDLDSEEFEHLLDEMLHSWDETQFPQKQRRRPSSIALPVSRVSPLEGRLLETEIERIFWPPLQKAVQGIVRSTKDENRNTWNLEPELKLMMHALLFYGTFWIQNAWTGDVYQNLIYRQLATIQTARDATSQQQQKKLNMTVLIPLTVRKKLVYGMFMLGLPYLRDKLNDFLTVHEWALESKDTWKYKIWKAWQLLETGILPTVTLLNFILFLYDARFRNVVDRLLGLQMVPRTLNAQGHPLGRYIDFDFINRQLLWQATTEFLLVALSRLRLRRLLVTVKRTFPFLSHTAPSSPTSNSIETLRPASQPGQKAITTYTTLPTHICTLCIVRPDLTRFTASDLQSSRAQDVLSNVIANAHVSEQCGHSFCYLCAQAAVQECQDRQPLIRWPLPGGSDSGLGGLFRRKERKETDAVPGIPCPRCLIPIQSIRAL